MSTGARDSARNSGTTSPDARPKQKPETELSEAEFLDRQAEQAKAAMSRAWQDIAAGLEQGVDPRAWAKEYPWAAMTTAAAAGFVAAVTLVPSKEQQALRKLAALERALTPTTPAQAQPVEASSASAEPRGSAFVVLFGELVKSLGPALASAITAVIASRIPATDTNGHPASAGPAPAESESDAPTE